LAFRAVAAAIAPDEKLYLAEVQTKCFDTLPRFIALFLFKLRPRKTARTHLRTAFAEQGNMLRKHSNVQVFEHVVGHAFPLAPDVFKMLAKTMPSRVKEAQAFRMFEDFCF